MDGSPGFFRSPTTIPESLPEMKSILKKILDLLLPSVPREPLPGSIWVPRDTPDRFPVEVVEVVDGSVDHRLFSDGIVKQPSGLLCLKDFFRLYQPKPNEEAGR